MGRTVGMAAWGLAVALTVAVAGHPGGPGNRADGTGPDDRAGAPVPDRDGRVTAWCRDVLRHPCAAACRCGCGAGRACGCDGRDCPVDVMGLDGRAVRVLVPARALPAGRSGA
jgi:hypothetical protein